MKRAKTWCPEVENSYRYQEAGWKSIEEYMETHSEPEVWPESGFVKCLQNKTTGFFMYFRGGRECEDKHLNKIKIYSY